MITFLEGVLEEKQPTRAVLNVGGVGYEVFIPLSSYDRLPRAGERCRLLIHDHIREDAHLLFGFGAEDERRMFALLLGVSGVGPKLALSALSSLSVRDLKTAVVEGDVRRLSSISGVGKKTAERLAVELRHKIGAAEAFEAVAGEEETTEATAALRDAAMALVSLGYKQEEARKMVRAACKDGETPSVEEVIRKALSR